MAAKTVNKSGYNVPLAAGSITAGGTLGILIPASIMLVVMGPILEVPVTNLFAAAIIPGFMLASLYIGYALLRCKLDPTLGPPLPEDMQPESMAVVAKEFALGLVPPSAQKLSPLVAQCWGRSIRIFVRFFSDISFRITLKSAAGL